MWHYNLGAMLFCIILVLLKYVKLELCSDNFRESRNFFFVANLEDKYKIDEQKKILQKEAEDKKKRNMSKCNKQKHY